MAGIIIPVMIHLWNVRPGKTLPVGSIALLKENGRQSSRRLQLSDLLLLLLRCLLIILLALLLAKPAWRPAMTPEQKGWVLMDKENLPETYQHFRPQIDALLQAGYTFHYFRPGFEEEDLQAALQETQDTPADSSSYWALLDSLQQHPGAPPALAIFTTNRLDRFHGPRPHIDTGVHWQVYSPADSVSSWQTGAYATLSDSVRVRKVTSRPTGNSYVYDVLPQGSVQADTATMQIAIFADTYAHDAGYLKAALAAIQQFTQRKIKITTVGQPAALPPQTDWLFWLSAQPLPATVNAGNIWRYDSGAVVNTSSWIIADGPAPIPLSKRVQASPAAQGKPLWKDGFGDPVLRLEKGNTGIYHFSSRLDPSWNELPWSEAFPALLLQLIFPDNAGQPPAKDRRAIAAQQLRPDIGSAGPARKRAAPAAKDLAPLCWALVFVLFLAERVWSFRTKKSLANG